MARVPPRPQGGWLAAVGFLGGYLFVAVAASAFITAAVVAILQPPELVWVLVLSGLTILFFLIGLRQYQPRWYAWLTGRPSEAPRTPRRN